MNINGPFRWVINIGRDFRTVLGTECTTYWFIVPDQLEITRGGDNISVPVLSNTPRLVSAPLNGLWLSYKGIMNGARRKARCLDTCALLFGVAARQRVPTYTGSLPGFVWTVISHGFCFFKTSYLSMGMKLMDRNGLSLVLPFYDYCSLIGIRVVKSSREDVFQGAVPGGFWMKISPRDVSEGTCGYLYRWQGIKITEDGFVSLSRLFVNRGSFNDRALTTLVKRISFHPLSLTINYRLEIINYLEMLPSSDVWATTRSGCLMVSDTAPNDGSMRRENF